MPVAFAHQCLLSSPSVPCGLQSPTLRTRTHRGWHSARLLSSQVPGPMVSRRPKPALDLGRVGHKKSASPGPRVELEPWMIPKYIIIVTRSQRHHALILICYQLALRPQQPAFLRPSDFPSSFRNSDKRTWHVAILSQPHFLVPWRAF